MIYESLYRKLTRLVGTLPEPDEVVRLKAPGFMDLVVEGLYRGEDGFLHLSLSHYYEQNGDLVPDPDMEVRVYPDRGMAEAFSFQDTYGYRAVYPAPGMVDVAAKEDLNRFLSRWLSNLLEQGHRR